MRRSRLVAFISFPVLCVFSAVAATDVPTPKTAAKRIGGQGRPLIEIDLAPSRKVGADAAALLGQQSWASKSQVETGDIIRAQLWIANLKRADMMPLLSQLRSEGYAPQQIRLREFGDIRLQLQFARIDGGKGPKAIKAAIESVPWIKNATFNDYHTRFQFRGKSKSVMLALQAHGEDVVRLDQMIGALQNAELSPTSLTVSRLFSAIPFGKPLPGDLKLTDTSGKSRLLASFKKPKRPLAVAFVSLKTKSRGYGKYKADPKLFERLGGTIEKYRDRVDFVAISANKHDAFADVVRFWSKTGLAIPLLHDAKGMARAEFNAQMTPPPHVFLFDADGLHRYAGDVHSNWQKPGKMHDDFLAKAIDLVIAGKYHGNGAVFYNSTKCSCSHPGCKCDKCGCGPACRCGIKHCGVPR